MSIQLQRQIKNNSEDLVKYVNDLYAWECEKSQGQKKEKKEGKKKSTVKKKSRKS